MDSCLFCSHRLSRCSSGSVSLKGRAARAEGLQSTPPPPVSSWPSSRSLSARAAERCGAAWLGLCCSPGAAGRRRAGRGRPPRAAWAALGESLAPLEGGTAGRRCQAERSGAAEQLSERAMADGDPQSAAELSRFVSPTASKHKRQAAQSGGRERGGGAEEPGGREAEGPGRARPGWAAGIPRLPGHLPCQPQESSPRRPEATSASVGSVSCKDVARISPQGPPPPSRGGAPVGRLHRDFIRFSFSRGVSGGRRGGGFWNLQSPTLDAPLLSCREAQLSSPRSPRLRRSSASCSARLLFRSGRPGLCPTPI